VILDGDSGGGGDPGSASGGVLVSLGEGLPSTEGEHGRLVPFFSSITSKLRAGKRNTKREGTKKRNARWLPAWNRGDIYSLKGVVPLQ
jgi:hypothetical protein